jgi:hypothetical protein
MLRESRGVGTTKSKAKCYGRDFELLITLSSCHENWVSKPDHQDMNPSKIATDVSTDPESTSSEEEEGEWVGSGSQQW